MKSVSLLLLASSFSMAQQLPDGPGRVETERLCKQCHEMARSISLRQDRAGWQTTMNKMVAFGMRGSEAEFNRVIDYLTTHYPAEQVPKVNVNTASAIELEAGLSLRRSQARALIEYRTQHGAFKTFDDLKKIPVIDPAHLEERQNKIEF
jgi:competence ComEA-like helix-hairpin-helix protein